MAEADHREARRRRRRILQQGSDRLAFIKGQIQSLPDPSSSSDLSPPDLSHGDGEAVEESNSVLQNRNASISGITETPPFNDKQDIQSEIYPISSLPSSEIEPEYVQPATPPDSSHETSEQQETDRFSIPSDLSSAINASRVTRLCCSTIIALLVVASYLGSSLFETEFINTVISFRPLYLVLLTNSTLVIARLVSGKKIGFGWLMRRNNSTGSSDWDSQLARTLEIALVLKTLVDAVFIDCAVYAIVLICGLSLVHH